MYIELSKQLVKISFIPDTYIHTPRTILLLKHDTFKRIYLLLAVMTDFKIVKPKQEIHYMETVYVGPGKYGTRNKNKNPNNTK